MYRLFAVLAMWPTIAAADWSPRPTMFTYEATFDLCTADPTAPDLAANCADALTAAYVLKRAVAWATYACGSAPLATCTAPFEDEGLPAIAMQIAIDIGCEATDVSLSSDWDRFEVDHCVKIASDIMQDEGIVPLFGDISCRDDLDECGSLAFVHVSLWIDRLRLDAPDEETLETIFLSNLAECEVEKFVPLSQSFSRQAVICMANRSASAWADLAQQNQQDQ
jgi:hypothetical protein